jgi:hypothetical protein
VNPGFMLPAAVILSSAFATCASGQTSDIGRALVVSDNLRLSADTPRSGGASTPVKEFIVPYAGVVRVEFQLKSDGSHFATASVVSLIDTSCDRFTKAATYKDLRVAGDSVRAQAFGESDVVSLSIRNVRVFYDVVDSTGLSKILQD